MVIMKNSDSLVGKFYIRETKKSDMLAYLKVCQKSSEEAYASKELGISKDLFSLDNFLEPETYMYWQDCFKQTDNNKSYVAVMDKKVVGGISGHKYSEYFEFNAYY